MGGLRAEGGAAAGLGGCSGQCAVNAVNAAGGAPGKSAQESAQPGVELPRQPPAPATETRARRSWSAHALPLSPLAHLSFRDKRRKKALVTATHPALSRRLGSHSKVPSQPQTEREDCGLRGERPARAPRDACSPRPPRGLRPGPPEPC